MADESDGNYSDVNWSDADGGSDDENKNSSENVETLHLVIGAAASVEADQKKRKREIAVYNDDDRISALQRHQDELRTAYYRALLVSKWCSDEFLAATMISLLPATLMQSDVHKRLTDADYVISVANWFKKYFRKLKDTFLTADEGRDGCSANDLISDVIPNTAGSAHQLNQLLVSLLRALGFEVRYVREINPCSYKPNGHEDLTARAKLRAKKSGGGSNGQKAKWARSVVDATMTTVSAADTKVISEDSRSKDTVIELLSDDEGGEGEGEGEGGEERVDENKIRSIKVKKEDIPKCWIEVYLLMPKDKDKSVNDKNKKDKTACATSKKTTGGTGKNRTKQDKASSKENSSSEGKKSDKSDKSNANENMAEGSDDVCIVDSAEIPLGRYVQLDLFNGGSKVGSLIDQPKSFESAICNRRPVAYVIAVDATGLMIDVTGRYSSDSGSTKKLRMPCIEWWDQLVHATRATSLAKQSRDSKESRDMSGVEYITPLLSSSSSSASSSSASSSSSILTDTKDTTSENISSNKISNGNISNGHHSAAPSSSTNNSDMSKNIPVSDDKNSIVSNNIMNSTMISNQKKKAEWRLSQQLKAEQEEFTTLALNEPLPTTLSGYKNHPLYTLHRDLKGDRGVNPANSNAIAGTFKDETVYFTRAVEDLKTRHQWRMVMKDVIMRDVVPTISLHGIDPTAEPGKDSDNTTLSATNGASNNKNASEQTTGNGENDLYDVDDCTVIGTDPGSLREPIPPHKVVTRKRGDKEVKLDLYGAWQTEPYMVEAVRNGIIPVNKHGNVEVWDYNEALVPGGARLLQSRHAVKAAQSLGLPFAPALVGFENKGQYSVPKIGGAVVLSEHYSLLLEAVGNIQEDKEEKAEVAWETKIVSRWADLVRKAMTRQRLKVQYGH